MIKYQWQSLYHDYVIMWVMCMSAFHSVGTIIATNCKSVTLFPPMNVMAPVLGICESLNYKFCRVLKQSILATMKPKPFRFCRVSRVLSNFVPLISSGSSFHHCTGERKLLRWAHFQHDTIYWYPSFKPTTPSLKKTSHYFFHVKCCNIHFSGTFFGQTFLPFLSRQLLHWQHETSGSHLTFPCDDGFTGELLLNGLTWA